MSRAGRLVGGLLVVAALSMTATACLPPPALLVVTATADAPDANPGDGVCEATVGGADCTLRAAVEEGNALGAAKVELPTATYGLNSPLVVTGHLTVNQEGTPHAPTVGYGALGQGTAFDVASGGHLSLDGVRVEGGIVVEGTAMVRTSTLNSVGAGAVLVVGDVGVAVLYQSLVQGGLSSVVVDNEGTLHLWYASVYGLQNNDVPILNTGPTGDTYLLASVVLADEYHFIGPGRACSGLDPVSHGYNGSHDGSCNLTGPGDTEEAPTVSGGVTYPDGSPTVDAIPAGVQGCGIEVTVDAIGNPRPVDYDGDGDAACDMGHLEVPQP